MTTANEYQVGGNHYVSHGLQHWDMVEQHGLGYLEGLATKYLVRVGRKGEGLQDLQKAKHCVIKLTELAIAGKRHPRGFVPGTVMTEFFCVNNIKSGRMMNVLSKLCGGWDIGTLYEVVRLLDEMIDNWETPRHIDNTGQQQPFGYDPYEEGVS